MKLRKLNRMVHRDLGYIFFGMTIIYSVSGIVLNHQNPNGDASIVSRADNFEYPPVTKAEVDRDFIEAMMEYLHEEDENYKNFYFLSDEKLIIYLKQGHINYNIKKGEGDLIKIKRAPLLYEFNFLHYNKPKKLWTWFSDIYAVSLGLMAISGLFILKGKNGIKWRGAVLAISGSLIPLIFLIIYLWSK